MPRRGLEHQRPSRAREAVAGRGVAAMIERVGAETVVVDPPSGEALFAALAETSSPHWRWTIWVGSSAPRSHDRIWRRCISLPEVSVFFAVECDEGGLHLDPDVHVALEDDRIRVSRVAERCRCGDPRPVLVLCETANGVI